MAFAVKRSDIGVRNVESPTTQHKKPSAGCARNQLIKTVTQKHSLEQGHMNEDPAMIVLQPHATALIVEPCLD